MGILDIFTGDPLKNAAANTRTYLGNTQADLLNRNNLTRDVSAGYLAQGYGDAERNLQAGYSASTDPLRRGTTDAMSYLDIGANNALNRLDTAKAGISGAYSPVTDLASRFGAGANLYSDALGINGAGGTARARDAFTTGPQYDFVRDQGINAIARLRNAAGSAVGGNADRDATDYASGLASKEYGGWLDRLASYNPLALSAANAGAAGNAAAAGLDVNAAGILNNQYGQKANLASAEGRGLSDLATRLYGGLAANDVAQGTALAGNNNALAGANQSAILSLSPGYAGTYKQEGEADMQGSKNLWGLGLELAKLGAGAAGGLGGGATAGFSGSAIKGLDPYGAFSNTLSFGGPR